MKYRLSPRLTDTGKRRIFSVKKARFLKRTGREYDNIYIEKQKTARRAGAGLPWCCAARDEKADGTWGRVNRMRGCAERKKT